MWQKSLLSLVGVVCAFGVMAADKPPKTLVLSLGCASVMEAQQPKSLGNVTRIQAMQHFLASFEDSWSRCKVIVKGGESLRPMFKPVSVGNISAVHESALNAAYLITKTEWEGFRTRHPETMRELAKEIVQRESGDFYLIHATLGDNAINDEHSRCLTNTFTKTSLTLHGLSALARASAANAPNPRR